MTTTETKLIIQEIEAHFKELKQQKKKLKTTIAKEKEMMKKNPASDIKIDMLTLHKLKKDLNAVVATLRYYNANTEDDYAKDVNVDGTAAATAESPFVKMLLERGRK
jgi:hypothetical protein